MTHPRAWNDTEPDDVDEPQPRPVPPRRDDRCCMCGTYNEPLFRAAFCEIPRPDGGYSYGPGFRCSDLRACRDRRTADKPEPPERATGER